MNLLNYADIERKTKMEKTNKYEQPYTYLKQLENRKITESFINSFLKANIKINDFLVILEFIKKDGSDVSSFEMIDALNTKNDELYFVFKDLNKGFEFIILYDEDVSHCQLGYYTKKGEYFSPDITIKDCIEHYDPKHCFISY